MAAKPRPFWQRALLSVWARPIVLVVILLVLWDLTIRIFRIPPYLIPAPEAVVGQLIAEWPRLWRESLDTTYATLGGFALSIAFGIPMALLIAYSRTVESFVYPLLVFSQSIPKIAIAPLFVVWFGFGIIPKVIWAFMLGFFPIVVSTVMGFKSVDNDMIDLARSMKAGKVATFMRSPAAGAAVACSAGLKVSVTLAVVGAVVGEFVGSNSGIGYVLQIANGNFDLPLMFAALVVLSMIGVLLFVAVDVVERLMIPWHARTATTSRHRLSAIAGINQGGTMHEAHFHAGRGALACALCSPAPLSRKPKDKVMLMLNWYVYSEHAPFFLGKERGYFEQEGIDLDIQEGRGSGVTVQAVAAGTAKFGYADVPTMIKAAAKGAPVIAIGVALQTSPMSVMGFADKNIKTPNDINGKTSR